MIQRLGEIFLDYLRSGVGLLFPRLCVVCGDVLVNGERFMCTRCLCGMPLNEGADEGADERMKEVLGAENIFWLFTYNRESDFHRLIYAIKYKSRRELGVWTGQMLGARIGAGYDHTKGLHGFRTEQPVYPDVQRGEDSIILGG